MVVHVLLLALGTFYAIDYYNWAVENDLLDEGFSWVAWLVPLMLLPVLIIILLLLTRRSFTVQAPVGVYRKFGLLVLGLVLALWALFVLGRGRARRRIHPDRHGRAVDHRLPDPAAAERLPLHHRTRLRTDRRPRPLPGRLGAGAWSGR